MRTVLAAAIALSFAAAPALAQDVPPEAQVAVDAVKAVMQVTKNARFRKLKVAASGDVCGTIAASASMRDMEFIWTKASGAIWINEAPNEAYSAFVYGAPHLRRSTERSDFQAWKACQKG
jgi:hypothetical protein